MRLNLSGADFEALRDAVASAYDPYEFDELLRLALGRKRHNITMKPAFKYQVFDVIDHAERNNYTSEFVIQAAAARPQDPALMALATRLGVVPDLSAQHASDLLNESTSDPLSVLSVLEGLTNEPEGIPNLDEVLSAFLRVRRRICRVEFGAIPKGTGFLVGPDRVLTNYHVVRKILRETDADKRKRLLANVRVRFDYWREAPMGEPIGGVAYGLAPGDLSEAIPHASPPTQAEWDGKENDKDPDSDHLDFALLVVQSRPGDASLSSHATDVNDFNAPKRGWFVANPGAPAEPQRDGTLIILQHPGGAPLSMAWNAPGVISVNETGTRVKYHNNTEPGSSGSPCLNNRLNVVALHHSGNLRQAGIPEDKALQNQGIPVKAIIERLRADGETVAFAP